MEVHGGLQESQRCRASFRRTTKGRLARILRMVLGARSAEGQKAKYSLRANDARSGPDNGHTATAAACPVRASKRLMHRSKQHLYSVTSSARLSNVGISMPSA